MSGFQDYLPYDGDMAQSGRPPATPRSAIGERIAKTRMKLGLSQRELAEKLDITQQSVAALERRISVPRSDTLLRLCEVLGVTANDLLGMDSPKQPSSRGRLGQNFEAVGKLPRRAQAKILDVVEAMLAQQSS